MFLLRRGFTLLALLLLGGFLGAVLVRTAPGFGVDERALDPRLGASAREALRRAHAGEDNVLRFYLSHLRRTLSGDLGESHAFRRPVRELLAERLGVTARTLALGLAVAWALALPLALAAVPPGLRFLDGLSNLAASILISLPSAAVALLFLLSGGAASGAVAAVLFPRILRYSRDVLLDARNLPHVLTARAKGIREWRVLACHVLPMAAPELIAVAGVSVSIAFGAAIPIEVICDSAGIGQLAWQAALARDLPLLVNLTLAVTVLALAANTAADLASAACRPQNRGQPARFPISRRRR